MISGKPPRKPLSSGWVALAAGLTLFILSIGLAAWNNSRPDYAPNFNLPTLKGGQLESSSLRGHVVLLNFWASWCVPCREEMPDLEAAQQRYKAQGLDIVGMNVNETREVAQAFVDELGVTFPIVLDDKAQTTGSFGVSGLPVSFLIDREGVIVYRHIGQFHPNEIDAQVAPLLARP
jgi:cytochrome c biogenesis protein CcmG/thiol:disulfide interchange protein DsbE